MRHMVRMGQTHRCRAITPYVTAAIWQSSRTLFLDVALHAHATQFALQTLDFSGHLTAQRSARSEVHHRATLLRELASEYTSINTEVSCNVRDGGVWLLT